MARLYQLASTWGTARSRESATMTSRSPSGRSCFTSWLGHILSWSRETSRWHELDGRTGRVVWHLILSGETAAADLLIDT